MFGGMTGWLFDDISLATCQRREQAEWCGGGTYLMKLIERLESSDKLSKENKAVILSALHAKRLTIFGGPLVCRGRIRTDKSQKQTHSSEPSWLDSIASYAIKSPVPKDLQSVRCAVLKTIRFFECIGQIFESGAFRWTIITKRCQLGGGLVCQQNTPIGWVGQGLWPIVNRSQKKRVSGSAWLCFGSDQGLSDNSMKRCEFVDWILAKLPGEKNCLGRFGSVYSLAYSIPH